jgi:hypothetical protein
MEFAQFYPEGGVLMHIVTLLSLIAGVRLFARMGGLRRMFRDPKAELPRLRRGDPLTPALVAAVVLTGALGAASGWIEVHAALQTVPEEMWARAFSLGSQIAIYPLVWGLVCAVPLVLAHGVLAYLEGRLQGLVDEKR